MSIPEGLSAALGAWEGNYRLWFGPGDPAAESHTTAQIATVGAGRFLTMTYTWMYEGRLARFVYTGPKPATVGRPAWGPPGFELHYRSGYATGIAASARLDRFLNFGVYAERFRRRVWYRMPPQVGVDLRRLTAGMKPCRVTPALVAKSG